MSIKMLKKRFAGRLGKGILIFLIAIFIVTLPLMFSGYQGGPRGAGREGQPGSSDVIAMVNGQPLTRAEFEAAYQELEGQTRMMMLQYGSAIGGGIERVWTTRLQALEMAEQNAVIMQDAKAKGVSVSSREVHARIDQQVDQDVNSMKAEAKGQRPEQMERMYASYAAQVGGVRQDTMSERRFRGWYADYLWDRKQAQVEFRLTSDKLKNMVVPRRPVTEDEARTSYDKVTARQILVALKPMDKPARTEAEAKQRADELLARIRGGADFGAVAREESDDSPTKTAGGLMEGPMTVGSMVTEWKRQLAPLKAGEMVKEPIKTPYGYYIVKVEKRERELPPEFEKNKQQEIARVSQQEQDTAWYRYTRDLLARAQVKVSDPELLGYDALRSRKTEEGLKYLEQASEAPDKLGGAAAAVFYELAVFYSSKNDWAKAAEKYLRADDLLGGGRDNRQEDPQARAQILQGLGRAYENLWQQYQQQGKRKQAEDALSQAVDWYSAASDSASDDKSVHERLQATFIKLGRPDLARKEQDAVAEIVKEEAERNRRQSEQQKAMEKNKSPRPTGPSPIAPQKP